MPRLFPRTIVTAPAIEDAQAKPAGRNADVDAGAAKPPSVFAGSAVVATHTGVYTLLPLPPRVIWTSPPDAKLAVGRHRIRRHGSVPSRMPFACQARMRH